MSCLFKLKTRDEKFMFIPNDNHPLCKYVRSNCLKYWKTTSLNQPINLMIVPNVLKLRYERNDQTLSC